MHFILSLKNMTRRMICKVEFESIDQPGLLTVPADKNSSAVVMDKSGTLNG